MICERGKLINLKNRVENAHLHSLGGLHVVIYIPLPYETERFTDKIEEVKNFYEFQIIISKKGEF